MLDVRRWMLDVFLHTLFFPADKNKCVVNTASAIRPMIHTSEASSKRRSLSFFHWPHSPVVHCERFDSSAASALATKEFVEVPIAIEYKPGRGISSES